MFRGGVVDVVAVNDEFEGVGCVCESVGKTEFLAVGFVLTAIVEDVKFRRGNVDETRAIDEFLGIELTAVELGDVSEHAQRHVGVPGTLVFHEDDVAIPDAEADVVLDVVEEHTAQCRDRDVLRRDAAAGQGCIEAGEPPFVVEDVAEQRIFLGSFRLHVQAPFLFASIISYELAYCQERQMRAYAVPWGKVASRADRGSCRHLLCCALKRES